MIDEEFECVGWVGLFHLLFLFPLGLWDVGKNEMAVVGCVLRVFDPEVTRGDAVIGKLGVAFDIGCVSPCAAEGEYAGRGSPVAFFFESGSGGGGVESKTPCETGFTEASGDRGADGLPFSFGFLVEMKSGVGAIPVFGDADDALGRGEREFEGGC